MTTAEQRGDCIAGIIERHRPWDAWQHADERDHWALVTSTGDTADSGLKWLHTFMHRTDVDKYVRTELQSSEVLVALVDLDTGTELVPVVTWVANECSWPTCSQPPAADGRQFLGGAMCGDHTAESYERDAAARDEIDQARAHGC